MGNNKLILGGLLFVAIVAGSILLVTNTPKQVSQEEGSKEIINKKPTPAKAMTINKQEVVKPVISEKKINLYNNNSQLALSTITGISELPPHTKHHVEEFIENCENLLFFQRMENKLILICENNSELKRHNIKFVEFDILSGSHTIKDIDYTNNETEGRDNWDYDKLFKPKRPIKHTKYNKGRQIKFIEIWNYEPDAPIKYEVKNADGNTVSILKEVIKDGTNMHLEHIFYKQNGEIKMSLSLNYEGSNLTRVTYYNADKPEEGASVLSEFADGLKTKETVYTTDYKVKNKYEAAYQDGLMVGITAFNDKNQEIAKYLAE